MRKRDASEMMSHEHVMTRSNRFSDKGFCESCGAYSRSRLTFGKFIDPVTGQRHSGLLCSNCYDIGTELETSVLDLEDEQDDGSTGSNFASS